MKRLLCGCLMLATILAVATETDCDLIRKQYIEYCALREKPMPQAEKYLLGLRPDGSWPDIDYASRAEGRYNI